MYNVGSIFRTADAAGVLKIFLTGYTPSPKDIFGKWRKEIAKTALGAEKYMPWSKVQSIELLLRKLRKDPPSPRLRRARKVQIVALEQARGAIDYRKFKPRLPLALVLGNEVRGLSKSLLQKCDKIIYIPMRGKKESLNVSVAAGVALFSLIRN